MENTLTISEPTWNDGGTDCEAREDPDAASLAVGVVVEGARKGVVALCASVAHIIREKNRLEERLKELESQLSVRNSARGSSPTSCTVMNHMSLSTKFASLPESPSALRQHCGSTLPTDVNSNIPEASGKKSMRYLHTERKKLVTKGCREHEGNNFFVNNNQNRNDCVCKESKQKKIVDDFENHECVINNKSFKTSSSKVNLINSKNCEIEYSNRDIKMCLEKNAKSSPESETSYEYNMAINNPNAGLRTSRSYSGSRGTSSQFLHTPDHGYGKNYGSFERDSKCWSTRSLNLGANLPRGSFMRRKYSTISLRRVKKSLPSKQSQMRCCSSGGCARSVSSSRGSSFDLGSRRSSDFPNAQGSSRKACTQLVEGNSPVHSGCDNFNSRSTSSGSNSILTVAEVHHEPEANNHAHTNTEREAVKLLARTLTSILREQSEAQELGESSSSAFNYVHNTMGDTHLDFSKQSSKTPICPNQKDSLVSSPISVYDDTKNQDCDVTFDVPSSETANTISLDDQSRVSDTFEIGYGQDTVDAAENDFPCNKEIQAPFPLAGCECPICERLSSNPNAKLFALTTDEGFLLPPGSAVLVHGDAVGRVLYMGHQRTTVAGMLLHHSDSTTSCHCSHSNSPGHLESCDTCGITDANVHAFTTRLAPIGVMCTLWNEERKETFVPLSAVICQLDEDSLVNSQDSSSDIKSSSHLIISEYEDVESDEDVSYNSYRYTSSRSHSLLSNEENNLIVSGHDNSVESERSDIAEEEEDNMEDMMEKDKNVDNIGKLQFTTTIECNGKWKQSEVYPSSVKDNSQRSFFDYNEDGEAQDDSNSIDRLSLYGLDYKDNDPDFTNHIESDLSLNEEFCSPNSVCNQQFHEYHNNNYLLASSKELRKMSNSVRVTISPTDSSKSQSIDTFDYPHSSQLNTTYLKEPIDHTDESSSDEKGESFESIDENYLESIKENTNFTKVNQHSLYDTCDSAISLSFIGRFSERNEKGTSEVSVSSSLQESGRESGNLGDTWGSSALSYPRCRSVSSGNVSDVETNHLSSTFNKDLAFALDSVLKTTQKENVNRGANTKYEQEFGKERSYNYNEGFPYNESIFKSQMNPGSNAWKALDNRYQEDSEV